jgi:hypothetical protein
MGNGVRARGRAVEDAVTALPVFLAALLVDEVLLDAVLVAADEIPLSRLQQGTGPSLRYVSLIRRGEPTPYPRHWQPLLTAAAR